MLDHAQNDVLRNIQQAVGQRAQKAGKPDADILPAQLDLMHDQARRERHEELINEGDPELRSPSGVGEVHQGVADARREAAGEGAEEEGGEDGKEDTFCFHKLHFLSGGLGKNAPGTRAIIDLFPEFHKGGRKSGCRIGQPQRFGRGYFRGPPVVSEITSGKAAPLLWRAVFCLVRKRLWCHIDPWRRLWQE